MEPATIAVGVLTYILIGLLLIVIVIGGNKKGKDQ